ncbi:caspase-3-like [Montipora capricornis]|uniref:caspase-3-like n=1 Tax=Montipora capricornis TaxID=246305 RepID=UPI0035F13309
MAGPKFITTIKRSDGIVAIGDNSVLTIGSQKPEVQRVSQEEDPQTRSSSQIYCQESSGDGINYIAKSGYVLVINNSIFSGRSHVERTGSQHDVKKLGDLFDNLNFKCRVENNLTRSKMWDVLKDTSEKDFSKYDCFVCVILSHGSEAGIHGTDDEVINLEAITASFRRDECPSLEGKPKIFMIQACRGHRRDQVSVESDSEPVMYSNPSLPADADFLICFSSAPSHESYREPSAGSWFISAVCKVFTEYSDKEHVMDMMLRVNKEVADYFSVEGLKQMPCEICMLRKKVFFCPRLNAS